MDKDLQKENDELKKQNKELENSNVPMDRPGYNIPEEFETWLDKCPVIWHKTGEKLIAPYEYDNITYTFSFDVPEEQENSNG